MSDEVPVALHIGLARVEEQLAAVAERVDTHMRDEHKEFREALAKVERIEEKVDTIYLSARLTRWLIGAFASAMGAFFWLKDKIIIK